MANIGQSIQFKGMDDTIEIWGQQEEEKAQMSSEEFSQLMEKLMGTTNSVFDE
jgi:DNA-binding transcriptional regulator/RsmH inhibitor MraZ